MIFLNEVIFRKMSKIGTMLSNIKKVRKPGQFAVNSMNFLLFFPQLRFEYLIVKLLRSLEVLQSSSHWKFCSTKSFVVWTKKWISLSNNMLFCCFMDFWVLLRPIPTKKQLSPQNCLLEIPGLVIVECFRPFYAKKSTNTG